MTFKRAFWTLLAVIILATAVYVTSGRTNQQVVSSPTWQYMFFLYNLEEFSLTALTDDDTMTTEYNELLDQLENDYADQTSSAIVHAMNYLGKFGWELAQAETVNQNRILTFKRAVQ